MTALGLSLLVNLVLVTVVGIAALKSATFRRQTAAPPPAEHVATIYVVPAESRPVADLAASVPKKRFARTTEDQAAAPEKDSPFIGERTTRATSERSPIESAPPLPSQAGIDPRDEDDIETTESDYRDGSLSESPAMPAIAETIPTPPAPKTSTPPKETEATKLSDEPGPDAVSTSPPLRETLAEGTKPVDVQVSRESSVDEQPKPAPEKQSAGEVPQPKLPEMEVPAEAVRPTPPRDPAFSGFQRKTAIMGSISRAGKSALNVENTALGRYQASISRAVEQEWQRNCVRHRDFITPGFLTVRFFIESSGKVRSVQFVGDMETGEVQKGFTLNSIRDAEIPAMPRDLRKEYDKEPLELIFRFYF